jgi:transcriptional regulator with XRE-family HTH domain
MAKKNASATSGRAEREKLSGQGDRLRRLRKAYGFETSNAFAAYIGIGYPRWNAFENDFPLSREVAFTLVSRFGVSLDWLFLGKIDAMPTELLRRLGELDAPDQVRGKRKI